MNRTLLLLGLCAAPLAAAEPIQQASEARLWLKVPPGSPPLEQVAVSAGGFSQADWEKDPELRRRQLDVQFPIRWWSWASQTIRFTPAADGAVELILNGPWAKAPGDGLLRQEILWDDLSATGATLANGGFEQSSATGPAAWTAPWAPYPAADAWPLVGTEAMAGRRLAATWHNRPLSQQLQVKAGRQVTLQLHAKAATPPGFVAPKALGSDTPAHRALRGMKRGVNLGNGWEAPPGADWGQHFTTADIDRIAAQGFDHIRVPVAWHFYLKQGAAGWEISPTLLAELEPVLRRALEKNLTVMLNWHHFDDFTTAPAAHLDRFVGAWAALARHFQAWPPGLFFELLNEPMGALKGEVLNDAIQRATSAIRTTNPQRMIVVGPGQWNAASELDQLRLPATDERLIVSIHCYDPFHFTHQGAGWAGFQALRGITFPGPPAAPVAVPAALRDNAGVVAFLAAYNTQRAEQNPCSARGVTTALDTAAAWSRQFGRPVHLGEFGAFDAADHASRERYLRAVRQLAEARGIPWTLWEWKALFGYWDPAANQPRFRAALFE